MRQLSESIVLLLGAGVQRETAHAASTADTCRRVYRNALTKVMCCRFEQLVLNVRRSSVAEMTGTIKMDVVEIFDLSSSLICFLRVARINRLWGGTGGKGGGKGGGWLRRVVLTDFFVSGGQSKKVELFTESYSRCTGPGATPDLYG